MLSEVIAREPGFTELKLLVPLLRALTGGHRRVILLAPPDTVTAAALTAFGIAAQSLLIVRARNAADRLWAVEQALRGERFGALLAWLPQDRCRPVYLRRMQAAARGARGPVFLFRELPAQFQPSPAPLRLLVLPRHHEQLSVQVLKRGGPVLIPPVMLDLPKPAMSIRLRTQTSRGGAQGRLPGIVQELSGAIRSTASVITQSRPPARNSAARSGSLMV